jgi:hypothetical protein
MPTIFILKPSRSGQIDERCWLIARKGGGLVLLQRVDHTDKAKGHPFSADRSRLRCEDDKTRHVPDDVIDALPWQGRGDDPRIVVDRSGPAAPRAFFS